MPKKKQTKSDWTEWAGQFAAAIVVFGLTYVVASWAIDSGRIFAYVLTFVGIYLGLHLTKKAVKKIIK